MCFDVSVLIFPDGPVGKPWIESSGDNILVGTKVTLTCTAYSVLDLGNPPATQTTWYLNNDRLGSVEGQSYIYNTDKVTDPVKFQCRLENKYGNTNTSFSLVLPVEGRCFLLILIILLYNHLFVIISIIVPIIVIIIIIIVIIDTIPLQV